MSYRTLADCVLDLERHGHLRRIDCELDPRLEIAAVQRRAFRLGSPALLFTRVKGCRFPMLGNLFGTKERAHFIFRHSLRRVETLLKMGGDPGELLKHPLTSLKYVPALRHGLPKKVRAAPVLKNRIRLCDLPQLVSWPEDGGAFITLPLVCTENPDAPGLMRSNIGMYRVQISGGEYLPNQEAGLHYQLHRGIGPHHAAALRRGAPLPVSVCVGGTPALTLAAVMPLPESVSELSFAGMLAGQRIPVLRADDGPLVLAEADFCLTGYIDDTLKPEGPFGDHLGYYSLRHDFPVMRVTNVYHRQDAIWPFTSVGRPPQEDTVFGEFIHELTAPLVPSVFNGIREVHAVDAAGVHPLLLAIGSERYTPYEANRKPREILTQAMHLLGTTQTSLAKYVLIAAHEDNRALSASDLGDFFTHMLERSDFTRDLHIFPRMPVDTLDYTGSALHEGSKMVWAAAGEKRRVLATTLPPLSLPEGFTGARLFRPGIAVCQAPRHTTERGQPDSRMEQLADALATQSSLLEGVALLVVVDDADFASADWNNFVWAVFTRSDPATDTYGARSSTRSKHWGCTHTLIIDARLKSFQAPPLEMDEHVERKIDALAVKGGPLHGLV